MVDLINDEESIMRWIKLLSAGAGRERDYVEAFKCINLVVDMHDVPAEKRLSHCGNIARVALDKRKG